MADVSIPTISEQTSKGKKQVEKKVIVSGRPRLGSVSASKERLVSIKSIYEAQVLKDPAF